MIETYGLPKKLVKVGLNQVQNCVEALGRLAGVIDFPVPPNSNLRKTSSKTITDYYMGGVRSFLPIAACAQQEGVRLDQNVKVLDFGCGVGRQLLHFTRKYSSPSFFACDIDDTAIAFIRKHYARVAAYTSKFTPPLDYETGFFDMVYSVSIFSHLNMQDQAAWLKELARVTKPGGHCFLTTEGLATLKWFGGVLGQDESALRARIAKDGFLYREFPDWEDCVRSQNTLKAASPLAGVEGSYGNTALSPDYIRKQWPSAGFEVRAVVEAIIDDRQDLVVLRRCPNVS
ncbi:MAG: class I SAM-dependent methyltransferase [Verrucomicrobiota bacterium]|jgi:SAM-dependent methyltransferase